ncbi:Structural maintenance of chromosomes protein 5 [Orbilia ellipsospora]|uniref:Structural maintenance of chromosomes protein 5 n=1 Tax=Orbilia ellipsospora TaxID=2528407 RepID=A0AAV9X2L2_9PEZI
MPFLVSSQRSRSSNSDADESDPEKPVSRTANPQASSSKLTITSKRSLEGEEISHPLRSASGTKRRRLTPHEDNETDEDEMEADGGGEGADGNDYEDENREVVIPVAEDYDSDESETGMADSLEKMRKTVEEIPHAPGAIVKVQLENFVTYTKVTFEPGPSLNMVIGPNGTGKSTLVCAICLGLGFGPEHLGRAKDVAEFVKNGSNFATIEIELKCRPTDEMNPTIKRRIGRDGSSQYWMDGKKSSRNAVNQLTKLMNIQIDNLCQFLPQDRVVEFAGLGPVPLLRETQRAAAPPEVLKDHETLKKLRSLEAGLELALDSDRQALGTMENRQKVLERDVAKLRERQAIQEYIKLLENAIPFVQYQVFRGARDTVKAEYAACREQLKSIEREQEPQMKQIEEAEKLRDELKQWLEDERAFLLSAEKDLKGAKENGLDAVKTKEIKAEADLKALIDEERDRKQNIEKTRKRIDQLEKTLANDPGPLDVTEYNRKMEDTNKVIRGVRNELNEINRVIVPLKAEVDQRRREISAAQDWISKMDNLTGRRVEFLRRAFPESHTVYEWLQRNKHKFKGPVYGPPMIECSIKNANYQAEIEALFSQGDIISFTCTNKADFDELMIAVYGDNKDRKGLGVSSVPIKYIEKTLEDFPRIASGEEVRSWGFDGLALDFIDGPEEVLSMLCNVLSLHRIGVSKSKLSALQQQAIKTGKNMAKWVAGNVLTIIRRRAEYGAETEVNAMIRDAKYFKTAQVETSRLSHIKARKSELESEVEERLDEINAKMGNSQDLERQLKSLEAEKTSIINEKAAKQQVLSQYDKAKTHMQNEQEKLSRYESEGRDFKLKVAEQETSMVELSMERVGAASLYAERVRDFVSRYDNMAAAELHFIEASSNLQHYNTWNQSFKDRIEGKRKQCDEVKARYDNVIAQAAKARDECRELMSTLSSAQSEEIQSTHSKKAVDELKAEIQQEEIRLESIHEGNPNAIKQYETREKEINDLRTTMEKKEADLSKHRSAIRDVRGRWEPRIDQLVSNISDAFSRSFEFIHCAGAVRIRKEGIDGCDFENWAIEIMVKFREAENMQVLTAQRQSGGERAVSTVFYLMALQSLARAPFRVVDEINQGMDPRNERLVHKRMVKIACKKHTSQYFLITPKLLVDLDYHERMKVLCINSGDWVAEDHIQDFQRYLAVGRRLMAAS